MSYLINCYGFPCGLYGVSNKLLIVYLNNVLSSFSAGSSDVSKPVGDSVQLDVQIKEQTFSVLLWKHNYENIIIRYYADDKTFKKYGPYKDRVEFNEETYSLTLKNLQKNDSGLYEAIIPGQKETTVAQYDLSVLNIVEAPVLTYLVTSNTCNSTLTCRGHDLSVSSTCYKGSCEEKEERSGGVALSLSIKGHSFICNHSNPFSWKQDELEMEIFRPLCADIGAVSPPAGQSAGVSVCLVKTGLYSIILIILLSAVITVHLRERCNKPS
ncbi:hypothetical protein AMEX_G28097 [Astyanax mexicanus]|uniref:Immunoglobulin domain-containing protein n=1 Tax=Astyanax mexicanus TaxID=7994 RepID=A0A8T2KRF2_ASTMX|nr:hypothetical protein AMEX_G28097 [Astyanax mexicanus]